MIPSVFECIADIPTLSSGKADRKKLPAPRPPAKSQSDEDFEEDEKVPIRPVPVVVEVQEEKKEALLIPSEKDKKSAAKMAQTPTEVLLAEIWAELFSKKRVLRTDDFFELGGHSVLAAQLVTRLRKLKPTAHVAMADIYNNTKLKDLAAHLTTTMPAQVKAAVAKEAAATAASAALAQPVVSPPAAAASASVVVAATASLPSTAESIQQIVAEIWSELFAKKRVKGTDDFFELGGHSVLAAQLVTRMRKHKSTAHVAMADVYNNTQLKALCQHLAANMPVSQAPPAPSPAVAISSASSSQSAASPAMAVGGIGSASEETPLGDYSDAMTYQQTFLPVSPASYYTTMVFQIPALVLLFAIMSYMLLLPWFLFNYFADETTPIYQVLTYVLGCLMAYIPILMLFVVVAKWTLIGRFKPGKYPLWGSFYYRWWFLGKLTALVPTMYLHGSFLVNWYYWALGMNVGEHVHISTTRLDAFDLITLGDHTSVGVDAQLQTVRVLQGYLIIGSIEVGNRCYVGAKSVIVGGTQQPTVIEDEGQLADLSLLPATSRIAAGEAWHGSPAVFHSKTLPISQEQLEQSTPSTLRAMLFGFGQVCGYAMMTTALFVAIAPQAWYLYNYSDQVKSALGVYWFHLVVPFCTSSCFLLLLAIEIVLLKWLLIGRWSHQVVWCYSFRYLLKWTVDLLMELSMHLLHSMYASLYLTPWFRCLGARLGKNVEISTATHLTTDFLRFDEGVFIADSALVGPPVYHLGYMHLGPVRIGAKTFVGNSALVPTHSTIGANSLVGVMSTAPASRLQSDVLTIVRQAIFCVCFV
jgi:carbonic anhydrase/acetyltransferase-like protein (isoleucine patch superfamily)